jgi:cell division protease FtsH
MIAIQETPSMPKKTRFHIGYIFLAILAATLIRDQWFQATQVRTIPYSEYLELVKAGKVSEVTVTPTQIQGKLKEPDGEGPQQFVTTRIDPVLSKDFEGTGTKVYGYISNNFFYDLLAWIVPAVAFFAIWFFMMKRLGGRGGLGGEFMSIGKSKAKVYVESDTKVTFQDVAGIDEAEHELQEIVAYLKNPADYSKLGGRMPKGILLVGPPGTGKTLLAKAVAGEAGVPFFSISGSEFVEMFVGVGAARVRDLFQQARTKAPAIVFIDELDALGKSRAAGALGGGHDEKEQTLNQLLVELDGFDSTSGLILLAATNRPEILDPALLRAGRFDRQVLVDRPDKKGRIAILNVHLRKIKALSPDFDVEKVAALTPGFTGADLANLCNEAALIATRRQAEQVDLGDFTEAVERIVAGLEKKNRILNETERRIVAYHEMGHALTAAALSTTEKVHKVSVIPRGIGALGYTIQRPTEDRFLMTREELENRISVLLAGRAAEKLVFNHLSTGAADDLTKATDIAWSMVTRYGMEESLGHVTFEQDQPNFLGASYAAKRYGEETSEKIDLAVRKILDRCFGRALDLLGKGRAVLEESAQLLLAKETLKEEELEIFFHKLQEIVKVDHGQLDQLPSSVLLQNHSNGGWHSQGGEKTAARSTDTLNAVETI